MDKKLKLKKCPCCGSEATIKIPTRHYFEFYQVVCNNCGLSTRTTNTPEDAKELWNERATKDLVDKIRERAIEANKNMELSDDIAEASAYGGQWVAFSEAAVLIEEG